MTKWLFLLLAGSCLLLNSYARERIVVLGDSITAGYGIDPDDAFPALVQQKIDQAKLPYDVINAGVSGDTTAGGLRRLSWLLRQPVGILVVELGGNDGLRGISPQETEKNLQQIVEKTRSRYPEAKIVISGMQMPANMGDEFTRAYREAFGRVAKQNQAVLIPFLLEGVGGRADLNQPDRIHPTAAGHRIIADTVWKVIEPLLSKSASSR